MVKDIVAVIAGYTAWSLAWLAGNAALHAASPGAYDEAGMTREAWILMTALAWSALCSLAAGWVTARLARAVLARRCLILAGFLLVTGIAVQLSVWDGMPLWYHIPFLLLLVPMTLLGGQLPASGQGRPRDSRLGAAT